jgi:hypothetical protein
VSHRFPILPAGGGFENIAKRVGVLDESGPLRSVVVGPLCGFKAVASLVLRVWEMAGMRTYRPFPDRLANGSNRL